MGDERLEVLNNSTRMIQKQAQDAIVKNLQQKVKDLEVDIKSAEKRIRVLEGSGRVLSETIDAQKETNKPQSKK